MKLERLALAIAVLAGGACGSSNGGGPPIPIDGIFDALAETDCDLFVRCGVFSEAAFCPLYFGQMPTGFNSFSATVAGVKAGKTKYNPAAARACIDAIGASGCGIFTQSGAPPPDVCSRVFTGTLADGVRCVADTACLAGSFCASPGNAGCDGVCTHGGTLCNDDTHCTNGQVCDQHQPTATSQGTCVPRVAPGAANQPCVTNTCATGLRCSVAGDTPTCVPIALRGQPCDGGIGACAEGLVCATGGGATSSTCVPLAARGEPCQDNAQCGGFISTLVCDAATGTCVDAPTSGPCAGPMLTCNSLSSYCDTSSGTPTCMPYVATGATCSILNGACGLPGTKLCATADASAETGTCQAPTAPAACLP